MLVTGGTDRARSGAGPGGPGHPRRCRESSRRPAGPNTRKGELSRAVATNGGHRCAGSVSRCWAGFAGPHRPPTQRSGPAQGTGAKLCGHPWPLWALTCLQVRERGEEAPGKVSSVLLGCVLGGVCGQELQLGWSRAASCGHRRVCSQAPAGGGAGGESWGAGGGPTPSTSASRESRFSSVEVWGPPPGGNATSIQAGGVYPSGQHRGPSVTLAWKLSEKTRRMAGIGGQPRPQQGSDHLGEAAPARDPGTRGCSAVNSGLLGFPRKPGPERLVFLWGPRL